MRLLICAGGTGGGVYPALAVHDVLTSKVADVETLWVGGEGGIEESLVKRHGIPFRSIPAAGVHGVSPLALPGNLLKIGRGVLAARGILNSFKPDVLFFTGGYVAFPMALAGRSFPSLLYVPDIEPGMALQSLASSADVIAVTTEQSQKFFNKRVYETGYPLRPDLALWDRQTAHQHLGVSGRFPILLVLGGSKGARSINLTVLNHLEALLSKLEIIHLSGDAARAELVRHHAGVLRHRSRHAEHRSGGGRRRRHGSHVGRPRRACVRESVRRRGAAARRGPARPEDHL